MQLRLILRKWLVIACLVLSFACLLASTVQATSDESYVRNDNLKAYVPAILRGDRLESVLDKLQSLLTADDIKKKISLLVSKKPFVIYIPVKVREEAVQIVGQEVLPNTSLEVIIKIYYNDDVNASTIHKPAFYKNRSRLLFHVDLKKGEEENVPQKIKEAIKQAIPKFDQLMPRANFQDDAAISNHERVKTHYQTGDSQSLIADNTNPTEWTGYGRVMRAILTGEQTAHARFTVENAYLEKKSQESSQSKKIIRTVKTDDVVVVQGIQYKIGEENKEKKKKNEHAILEDLSYKLSFIDVGKTFLIPIIKQEENNKFFASLDTINQAELDDQLSTFSPYAYLKVEYISSEDGNDGDYKKALNQPTYTYSLGSKQVNVYTIKINKTAVKKNIKSLVDALQAKNYDLNIQLYERSYKDLYEDAGLLLKVPNSKQPVSGSNFPIQFRRLINEQVLHEQSKENLWFTLQQTFATEVSDELKKESFVIIPVKDIDQEGEPLFFVFKMRESNAENIEKTEDGVVRTFSLPFLPVDDSLLSQVKAIFLKKYVPRTLTVYQQKQIIDSYANGKLQDLVLDDYTWLENSVPGMTLLMSQTCSSADQPCQSYTVAYTQIDVQYHMGSATDEKGARKELFPKILAGYVSKRKKAVVVDYQFKGNKTKAFIALEESPLPGEYDFEVSILPKSKNDIQQYVQSKAVIPSIVCQCNIRKGFLGSNANGDSYLRKILKEVVKTITKEFNIAIDTQPAVGDLSDQKSKIAQVVSKIVEHVGSQKGEINVKLDASPTPEEVRAYQHQHLWYSWSAIICDNVDFRHTVSGKKKIIIPCVYTKKNQDESENQEKKIISWTIELCTSEDDIKLNEQSVIQIPAAHVNDNPVEFAQLIQKALELDEVKEVEEGDHITWTIDNHALSQEISYIEAENIIRSKNVSNDSNTQLFRTISFHERGATTNIFNDQLEVIQEEIQKASREQESHQQTSIDGQNDQKSSLHHVFKSVAYQESTKKGRQQTLANIKLPTIPKQEDNVSDDEKQKKKALQIRTIYDVEDQINTQHKEAEDKLQKYVFCLSIENLYDVKKEIEQIKTRINNILDYTAFESTDLLDKQNLIADIWNEVAHAVKEKLEKYKNDHPEVGNKGIFKWLKYVFMSLIRRSSPVIIYRKGNHLLSEIEQAWKDVKNIDERTLQLTQDISLAMIGRVTSSIYSADPSANLTVPITKGQALQAAQDDTQGDAFSIRKCYWDQKNMGQNIRGTTKRIEGSPHISWIAALSVLAIITSRLVYIGIKRLFNKKKDDKNKELVEYGIPEDDDLSDQDDEEEDEVDNKES
ncbi:MAG: hypothetical protein AAF770_01960 [Bacteroidota bacterium]